MDSKQSFLKNHADAIVIIGVNIAIASILSAVFISNTCRIDSTNARMDFTISSVNERMDTLNTMFYDLIREKNRI